MMTFLANLVTFLAGFLKLFGHKESTEPVITVKTANQTARVSADAARETAAATHEDLNRVQAEISTDLDRLNDADSLRKRAEIVRESVRRANAEPGADS